VGNGPSILGVGAVCACPRSGEPGQSHKGITTIHGRIDTIIEQSKTRNNK
jgi:hypothetical protein